MRGKAANGSHHIPRGVPKNKVASSTLSNKRTLKICLLTGDTFTKSPKLLLSLLGVVIAVSIGLFVLHNGNNFDEEDLERGYPPTNRKRLDIHALVPEIQSQIPKIVTTPLSLSTFFPADHESELLWGTYRPQLYFGMRTRSDEDALMTGLMWYEPTPNPLRIQLRHVAKSEEAVSFQWIKHDGRTFGIQHINDTKLGLEMNVSFVKHKNEFGGDWVMRVTGQATPGSKLEQLSLMYYVGLEKQKNGKIRLEHVTPNVHLPLTGSTIVSGQTPSTSSFSLVMVDNAKKNKKGTYFSGVRLQEEWQVERTLRIILPKGTKRAQLENIVHGDANVFVAQRFKKVPFEFEVAFVSNRERFESSTDLNTYVQTLVSQFDADLAARSASFDAQFEEALHLQQKGYSSDMQQMAQVTISNLMGGIGYFHGHNRIVLDPKRRQSIYGDDEHAPKWGYTGRTFKLTTATPSRSYFPRGFLWDEGFHQLVISQFDKELSKDMLLHWLHLLHDDGWIPREQILGTEAETRVPEEFIPQKPDNANPPTFFFPIESIMNRGRMTEGDVAFLNRAFGQLANNFLWYMRTQRGKMKNTFRWRGAQGIHTLASGLDDYPRAVNRTELEEHVDLHCWMINSAHNLNKMAIGLERFDLPQFKMIEEELIAMLQERYWNPLVKAYCDYDGNEEKLIEHIGYVNLFPMLFGLIQIDSPRLADTLALLENDTLLRSPFGIRSLSKSDPLFGTEENYWRGPIWINMNYLTLRALHRYYTGVEGPYQERAQAVYNQIRRGVINNIYRVYKKQGATFENYNANNGHGQGQHPFAGWTSLVLLIMAEIY